MKNWTKFIVASTAALFFGTATLAVAQQPAPQPPAQPAAAPAPANPAPVAKVKHEEKEQPAPDNAKMKKPQKKDVNHPPKLEQDVKPGAKPMPAPEAKPDHKPAPDAKPDHKPAPDAKPDHKPALAAKPDHKPAPDADPIVKEKPKKKVAPKPKTPEQKECEIERVACRQDCKATKKECGNTKDCSKTHEICKDECAKKFKCH